MASSDGPRPRRPAPQRLAEAELGDCVQLSTAIGWNQVAEDWRLFFDFGEIWGVRDGDRLISTAALLRYPPSAAWLSMVLTAPEARGRGLATMLTEVVLKAAIDDGLAVQLDATPAGASVYTRLGFRPLFGFHRWRRAGRTVPRLAAGSAYDEVIGRLDAAAIGFDRAFLMERLIKRGPSSGDDAGGFALSRDGRTAYQVGPIVAADTTRATGVTDAVLANLPAEAGVIVDLCDHAEALARHLQTRGFEAERPFTRMAYGVPPDPGLTRLFAVAGPELG